MSSLARCDFKAKSSDCPKLLDGDRNEMRQKRNACAAFTSVPMLQTRSNYMPMPSGASSRKSLAPFNSRDQALAVKDKEQEAQAVMPAPEEKNGARTVACPVFEWIQQIRTPRGLPSGTGARRSWRR